MDWDVIQHTTSWPQTSRLHKQPWSIAATGRGPAESTISFVTWLKYHDCYVPRSGWNVMTQYILYFIEITTMVHFAKESRSKYHAFILIHAKINYFVHASSLLLRNVEKKHKIENKIQLNAGEKSTPSFDSQVEHCTWASSRPHWSSGWFSLQPQTISFQDARAGSILKYKTTGKSISRLKMQRSTTNTYSEGMLIAFGKEESILLCSLNKPLTKTT